LYSHRFGYLWLLPPAHWTTLLKGTFRLLFQGQKVGEEEKNIPMVYDGPLKGEGNVSIP